MEERIIIPEDRNLEMISVEEKRKLRFLKSEETLWELLDFFRIVNIRLISITEEEKKGAEKLFKELIAENFPNLVP